MNLFRLYVEEQEVEGIVGEVVYTASINNLRDISTRNGNYTNTFSVPRTNINRIIFGSPEIVQSASGPVYRKLSARVEVDGLPIQGFVTFKSSEETYRINFFSGSSDFNTSIRALDITGDLEEDLAYLNHTFNLQNVVDRRRTKTGVIYPNIDFGYMARYTGNSYSIPYRWLMPAVYIADLITVAITKLGYRLLGTPFVADSYKNLALLCLEIVQGNAVGGGPASYGYTFPYNTFPLTIPAEIYISFPDRQQDNEPPMYTELSIPGIGLVRAYEFPGPVVSTTAFKLEIIGTISMDFPGLLLNLEPKLWLRLDIINKTTGALVGSVYEVLLDGRAENTHTFNLNIVETQLANINLIDADIHVLVWHIRHTALGSDFQGLRRVSFNNVIFTLTQFVSGENSNTVQVAKSLPPTKVGELFKAVCNIEGVFTLVDEDAKTVTGYYYEDIKKNIIKAVDWSNKVDLSEQPKIEYRFNEYGQHNRFVYEQDTDDIYLKQQPNFDSGVINVADTNLTDTVDIVTIPFGTVPNEPTFNGKLSMGKVYSGEKYSFSNGQFVLNPGAKIEKFSKRIVRLVDGNLPVFATLGYQITAIITGSPGKIIVSDSAGEIEVDMNFSINNIDGNQTKDGTPLSGQIVGVQSIDGNEITIYGAIVGTLAATTGLFVRDTVPVQDRSREVSSMNFNTIINNRYGLIKDVLTRTKIVRMLFILSASDIYSLDFSKPVYVELLSEYFYINTVNQFKFTSKESTQVELVRI